MPALSVLLVGDIGRAEFRDACGALGGSLGGSWQIVTAADVEIAARLLSSGQCVPDVLVMVQSFPGQWSAATVDRLRRLAPMARVVGLLGSWCEGEERTGRPWSGAIRCYWHQWPARAPRQLQAIQQGQLAAWGLPETATEQDRCLCEAQIQWPRQTGLVIISSCNPVLAEWLCDACVARGWASVWLRAECHAVVKGAAAGIFEAPDLSAAHRQRLQRLCAMVAPAAVLALLDFPRVEDVVLATWAGAAAVLSKPVQLGDLYWQLDRLVGRAQCDPTTQVAAGMGDTACY